MTFLKEAGLFYRMSRGIYGERCGTECFWNNMLRQAKAQLAEAHQKRRGALAQETGQEATDNDTRKHTPSRGAFP